MAIYKGFSFFRYEYDKSIVVNDIDLVKIDLYNHIFTRKGERIKMPTFGTSIPDLLFEPLDDNTLLTIHTELESVFKYDPRVEVLNIEVVPFYDLNTVYAFANLRYIELNLTDRFDLKLEFKG